LLCSACMLPAACCICHPCNASKSSSSRLPACLPPCLLLPCVAHTRLQVHLQRRSHTHCNGGGCCHPPAASTAAPAGPCAAAEGPQGRISRGSAGLGGGSTGHTAAGAGTCVPRSVPRAHQQYSGSSSSVCADSGGCAWEGWRRRRRRGVWRAPLPAPVPAGGVCGKWRQRERRQGGSGERAPWERCCCCQQREFVCQQSACRGGPA
jgi:hypothetical protein